MVQEPPLDGVVREGAPGDLENANAPPWEDVEGNHPREDKKEVQNPGSRRT